MRKILIILLLTFISLPVCLQAGQTGILRGKILDQDGKPVMGASVRILGTSRGAYVKNPDGSFAVTNIDAGTYTVKITAVGFSDTEMRDVNISADKTTSIDIQLAEKSVTLGPTIVYGNRALVNNTEVGQVRTIDKQEMTSIAREGISAIVGMTAGVVSTGGGYAIRGSRTSETTVKVDGINKTNKITGGTAPSGISEFDTEEIQVRTGGMGAEYGGAIGGVVNTVMKRGKTDTYEGYLRYRTDLPFLFGSQSSGKALIYDDALDAYQAIPRGEGAKLQGPGQHRFGFGTGGPLPYLDGSTFYISSNYTYRKFNGASYEIYDPWGNNLGLMPDDQNWDKNISARLRFAVMPGIEITVGGDYGSTNNESSSSGWLYTNDEGLIWDWNVNDWKRDASGNPVTNGIPERIAKQTVANYFTSTAFVRLNHTLSETSYYQLTVSNSMLKEEYSKRIGWDDPNYLTGFDVWYPQDVWKVKGSSLVQGNNKIIDQYEILKKTATTADGYAAYDFTQPNILTGYIEGPGDATGTNNPWGRQGVSVTHGNTSFAFRNSNQWAVDGSFVKMFSGEFKHTIRSGFEFYYYEINRHNNNNPWDGNPFFDVYTSEWNGNLYTELYSEAWAKTSKPFNPVEVSAYAMDQIEYKGIIITPSMRFDLFMPQADYRTYTDKFVSIVADSGFASASMKYQISPRINVTYPITDRSNISINYGLYFQMPLLQYMYDGFSTITLRGNSILGDPNMDAQRTNQYEVSYNNQLTDDFALTVAAYYKDIYNQVGQIYVATQPVPYYQWSVSEYGNIKGLEFTLQKRPTPQDHISLTFNYALAQNVATSSGPGDNYQTPIDPYSGLAAFPLSEFPTATDIRHRINSNVGAIWFNDQGPSIGGIYPIENTQIFFTTVWVSGAPYTKTDFSGRAIGEIRTERGPSYWRSDMNIGKEFPLKDWFGESMGNTKITLKLFVYNVFNLTDAVGLYTSTGDADDPGQAFRYTAGFFSSVALHKTADFSDVQTLLSQQYDNFGNRLYTEQADLDKNGIVNQQEKFDAYIRQLEMNTQFQGNYQAPRSVFFDVMFNF